jgi:hypothetical protein
MELYYCLDLSHSCDGKHGVSLFKVIYRQGIFIGILLPQNVFLEETQSFYN